MIKATRTSVSVPMVEALEARVLLSGNVLVSVAGESLLITGDSADNHISIQQDGQGAYTILGAEGTTVNGKTQDSKPGAYRDIILNMASGGADTVELASNMRVGRVDLATLKGPRGSISYTGGAGDDRLLLGGKKATGNVTFTANPSDGDTITVSDALGQTNTFEFQATGGVGEGNIEVLIGGDSLETLQNFIEAFNDVGGPMSIVDTSHDLVVSCRLTSVMAGTAGNEPIAKNSASIEVDGMAGGVDFVIDCLNVQATLGGGNNWLSIGTLAASEGLVSMIYGNVSVTGTAGDDVVVVHNTTIAGNVTANLGGGENTLALLCSDCDGVGGNVTFTGGAGDDGVYVFGEEAEIGGNLIATLGAGDNELEVTSEEGIEIGGNVIVTAGIGGDDVELEGCDVLGNVSLTLGGGEENYADLSYLTCSGTVSVKANGGDDDVDLSESKVLGNVSLDMGAGQNEVILNSLRCGGTVSVKATGGEDRVELNDAGVLGGVSLNLGGGSNHAYLQGLSCEGPVSVKANGGDDDVDLSDAEVLGSVSLDLGAGDNEVYLNSLRCGGAVSVKANGGGDYVDLGDGEVHGSVSLDLGAGQNEVDMTYLSAGGNVQVTTGKDNDRIYLHEADISGNLLLNLGAGVNYASTLDEMYCAMQVSGNVIVNMGVGNDELVLTGVDRAKDLILNLGAGDNKFSLANGTARGNLAYTGATGKDTITIGDEDTDTEILICGDVKINTGAGDDKIDLYDLDALKNLTINTGQSTHGDALRMLGTGVGGNLGVTAGNGADKIDLEGLWVGRSVAINTGAGDDTVDMISGPEWTEWDWCSFCKWGGAFGLNTGQGNDDVNVGAADQGVTFWKRAAFDMGAGDDSLSIKSDCDFLDGISATMLNGGAGDDTLEEEAGIRYVLEPTRVGFEP
jgi:hypothetical protein